MTKGATTKMSNASPKNIGTFQGLDHYDEGSPVWSWTCDQKKLEKFFEQEGEPLPHYSDKDPVEYLEVDCIALSRILQTIISPATTTFGTPSYGQFSNNRGEGTGGNFHWDVEGYKINFQCRFTRLTRDGTAKQPADLRTLDIEHPVNGAFLTVGRLHSLQQYPVLEEQPDQEEIYELLVGQHKRIGHQGLPKQYEGLTLLQEGTLALHVNDPRPERILSAIHTMQTLETCLLGEARDTIIRQQQVNALHQEVIEIYKKIGTIATRRRAYGEHDDLAVLAETNLLATRESILRNSHLGQEKLSQLSRNIGETLAPARQALQEYFNTGVYDKKPTPTMHLT